MLDKQQTDIVGVIDKNFDKSKFFGRWKSVDLQNINEIDYDYVVICSRKYQKKMAEALTRSGVPENKIVVMTNCVDLDRTYLNEKAIEQILPSDFCYMPHAIRGPVLPFKDRDDADYVRKMTLALVSEMLKKYNIEGACAELGVFRGEFARLINEAFPDRNLYLFDTFEGFDERDIKSDGVFDLSYYASNNLIELMKDTSVEYVISRMPYPQQCIVRKGYFPDTTVGIDETIRFSFVNIDTDLYSPILAGLEFFYPRMSKHGIIMVHDYAHKLINASQAVDDFAKKNSLIPIPVADEYGSIMFVHQ